MIEGSSERIDMQNYKMTIAYDGRRFKGFRKTKSSGENSIQGKLEAILRKKYEVDIEVVSAINTDAGVHATKQVVNFKLPDEEDLSESLFDYFETYLPDDIITLAIEAVEERFHSRYQVQSLVYEYILWKSDALVRPLFERQRVNRIEGPLTIGLMKEGAKLLEGEHDFVAFATKAKAKSTVKDLQSLTVEADENRVVIRMAANGYLLNMERIIAGTLIQIGLCQKELMDIELALSKGLNKYAGHKAMAPALTLVDVLY